MLSYIPPEDTPFLASMKTFQFLLSLFVLLDFSFFFGCEREEDAICLTPSQVGMAETIPLNPFTSLDIRDAAHVYLSCGEEQEVRVIGEKEVLDFMTVVVVEETLIVDLNRCMDGPFTFDVFITVPDDRHLMNLYVSGASKLTTENLICVDQEFNLSANDEAEIFFLSASTNAITNINASGSGDIFFGLTGAHHAIILQSGSGDITLRPSYTPILEVTSSGSGDLHAFGVLTLSAELEMSGSGNAEVYSFDGAVKADIAGSGSVYYKGNPYYVKANITGTGAMINAN